MTADSRHLSGIPFLHSHLYAFDQTLPISYANHRGQGQLWAQQAYPRSGIAIESISFCAARQHHVPALLNVGVIGTFVALGRRASADIVGIPGHSPEPGTSGRLHLGNHRVELDHRLVRIQWEVAEAGLVQVGSSALLGVGWGRPMVRCLRLQRALSLLQPCAGCLLPSYVASTPFEFPWILRSVLVGAKLMLAKRNHRISMGIIRLDAT